MKVLKYYFSFILLVVYATITAQTGDDMPIKKVFDIYTNAVIKEDLVNLFSTISDKPDFHFLTAQGSMIKTRQEYYQFHEEWFNEKGWEISFEEPLVYEEENLGYTMSIFHYSGKMEDGRTAYLDSYFTLVYHKENGSWKIIADICTPIKREIK